MRLITAIATILTVSCNTNDSMVGNRINTSDSLYIAGIELVFADRHLIVNRHVFRSDTSKNFPLSVIDLLAMHCNKSIAVGYRFDIAKKLIFKSEFLPQKEAIINFSIFEDKLTAARAFKEISKKVAEIKLDNELSSCKIAWQDLAINNFHLKGRLLVFFILSGFDEKEIKDIEKRYLAYTEL